MRGILSHFFRLIFEAVLSMENGGGWTPDKPAGSRQVVFTSSPGESHTVAFSAHKKTSQKRGCFWGRLDSNQRSRETRDLQSLAIATMRHPLVKREKEMLAKGIEPSTVRLQGGCSTIELHQQN